MLDKFHFLLLLLFLISCKGDVLFTALPAPGTEIVDLGEYRLLASSVFAIPYLGKKQVQFRDSLGQSIIFKIEEQDFYLPDHPYSLIRYGINQPGDTVRYHYRPESKKFMLRNDSHKLNLELEIQATPYYSDPASLFVADILKVYYKISNASSTFGYQVFSDYTSLRTWPVTPTTTNQLGKRTFFGRTFSDVLQSAFPNSIAELYFNDEVGIVAFTDADRKTWRFDQFLE